MSSPTKRSPEPASGVVTDEGVAAEAGLDTIEAADVDDESDAGYETDTASAASTSLSSSIRDYAFENGRRYHKFREGSYQFPNDEPEQAREDMKHAMIVNVCNGKLHYAPLEKVHRVLDLGTGTGIWSIDSKSSRLIVKCFVADDSIVGDEYPEATILGIDRKLPCFFVVALKSRFLEMYLGVS